MLKVRTMGFWLLFMAAAALAASPAVARRRMQIFGIWHCSNDSCIWGTVRNMADFNAKNHWIIDRGDGKPSVNLVVLSFIQPEKLLNLTTDAQTVRGIPIGMTPAIISYFSRHGIRVMISIGGATYVAAWDQALATNPTQLGLNAARAARRLGVGMEIDYENNTNPNLKGLEEFVQAYRSLEHYDRSGRNQAARLTIDLGAWDQYLSPITRLATSRWLNPAHPVLDYANAMVPDGQPTAQEAESYWQQHLDGKPAYNPPIPPLAPSMLAVSLFLVTGMKPAPECVNFKDSLQRAAARYVETAAPHGAGKSRGFLGYMFWAAGCQGGNTLCTWPPNTCENGLGRAAAAFHVPIPMKRLRQK